jgi:predicted nucleic-acid-binding protein
MAIDTNVIVRLMVQDDIEQFERAQRLIASEAVFVQMTVLLETEWVLRKTYTNTSLDITSALRTFLRLETVHVVDAAIVHQALDAYENGMDFADALHLAQAAGSKKFATFDKKIASKAKRLEGFVPVITP